MQSNFRLLGIVLSVTLLVCAVSLFFLYYNPIEEVNDSSNLVNVAGRQRMLSQAIVKEFLLEKYVEGSKVGAKDSQVNLFIKSHEAILVGSEDLGLGKLNDYYLDDYENLDRFYNKFVALFPEDTKNVTEAELIALADEQRVFIVEMNNFVEELARGSTDILSNLQMRIIIGSIILVLLILSAYFIFVMPSNKEIINSHSTLGTIKSELEEGVVVKLKSMISQADTIDYYSLPQAEIDKIDNLRLEGKRALNVIKKNTEYL